MRNLNIALALVIVFECGLVAGLKVRDARKKQDKENAVKIEQLRKIFIP